MYEDVKKRWSKQTPYAQKAVIRELKAQKKQIQDDIRRGNLFVCDCCGKLSKEVICGTCQDCI